MKKSTNPYQKFGEGSIKTDAKSWDATELSYSLSGVIRNKTDNGQGFSHKTQGGWVKFKIELSAGLSIDELMAMDDVTVVWTTDTGQNYTAAHAWQDGEIEVVAGGFEVTFCFKKHQEIINGRH